MQATSVPTKAYQDQKAGTSGLRKKVIVFQQENYLENFVQSIFDSIPVESRPANPKLVVSGDGRYWNQVAIQKILSLSAGNGISEVIIGQHGHLSTPAISNLIRKHNEEEDSCIGGILLTASHNPGGPENDFGIKFNGPNGGPALEALTNEIYEKSKVIDRLLIKEIKEVDLSQIHNEE
jgi:phosphoglucomutase